MKNLLHSLLSYRTTLNNTSKHLFVKAVTGKVVRAAESPIVKLENPEHLTPNGLRHEAATFSRLLSSHPQYQDYLASLLGHSLSTASQKALRTTTERYTKNSSTAPSATTNYCEEKQPRTDSKFL